MSAASNEMGSGDPTSFQTATHDPVSCEVPGYDPIPSRKISDTTIGFEKVNCESPTESETTKNYCKTITLNEFGENEMIVNGDNNEMTNLPEPITVLYPSECIQLGWQEQQVSVGSGLYNSGLICYINSTLQALFHIPAFTNWLTNDQHHQNTCHQNNRIREYCVVCMVSDTFKLSQKHTGSSFMASDVTSSLHLICQNLSVYRQEDAHEFLRYLLDSMAWCYVSVLGDTFDCLDNYSKETTPIHQIFGGYTRSEVKCGECGYISTTFQHFQELNLDIGLSDTVNDALGTYFEKERLEGGYTCQMCQRQVVADKMLSIERAPNVLCIQLKRFSVDPYGFYNDKNSKAIEIHERLDLSEYQFDTRKFKSADDARPLRYRLVSTVEHIGTSLHNGHYTALGLTPSGSYYYFNDAYVHRTGIECHYTSGESYILFYELEPSGNAKDTSLECNTSTATSSSCKPTLDGFFSNEENGVTKSLDGIIKKDIFEYKTQDTHNKLTNNMEQPKFNKPFEEFKKDFEERMKLISTRLVQHKKKLRDGAVDLTYENSFVAREVKQDKNKGVKRSFGDDTRVVKRKKFEKNNHDDILISIYFVNDLHNFMLNNHLNQLY